MKRRSQTTVVVLALWIFLGLVSCSSDDNKAEPTPPKTEIKVPSAIEFQDFRKRALANEEQHIVTTLDENSSFSFVSKKGVTVRVSNLSSIEYWGKEGDSIHCTFIELYDKGNMALTNRPTMGVYPNKDESGYFDVTKDQYGRISTEGHRGFIITGGEFYIDIKLNGKQLTYYGIDMEVPVKNTRGYQEDMLLWQGNINEKDDLTFTEIPIQTEMGFLVGNEDFTAYELSLWGWNELPNEIGWTNIDKYAGYEESELTQFFVKVPQGYNYENSAVYLGVKNEEGLAQLDVFLKHPELGDVFTEHFGWVPVGLEGYVLFISVDASTGKVVYAINEVKVQKNQMIEIKQNDLKTGTNQEVIDLLNQLK